MTVTDSNRQFAQFCADVRERSSDALVAMFIALVAFLNDRLLPSRYPLDAECILAWCREFLAKYDAGENQYRGVPVDPAFVAAMDRPIITGEQDVMFRGAKVNVQRRSRRAHLLAASLEQPFVPDYQKSLKKLMAEAEMVDMDLMAATPEMEPCFRGREL